MVYLFVRLKLATSIPALVTLGFAFCFSWIELTIYIHAMLIHGILYWENQFIEEHRDLEQGDLDYVFPESTEGYIVPTPVKIGICHLIKILYLMMLWNTS